MMRSRLTQVISVRELVDVVELGMMVNRDVALGSEPVESSPKVNEKENVLKMLVKIGMVVGF
jgi:hypothetical protein